MTSLSSPSRRRDGSKSPRREELKHYPSLKKSLSASYSTSSLESSETFTFPSTPSNAQSTTHEMAPSNPQISVSIPNPPEAAGAALAALHYLPTPLLVLSSVKTIILANEAMGRLLGLDCREGEEDTVEECDIEVEKPILKRLVGQSLSEVGVHILEAGQRVWVGWEKFLENLAVEMDNNAKQTEGSTFSRPSDSPQKAKKLPSSKVRHRSFVHDAVVQVGISPEALVADTATPANRSPAPEVQANMIISIWNMEDERYYTCTFTSAASTPLSPMRTHVRALSGIQSQATPSSSSQSTSSSPISPGPFPSPAFTSSNGVPLSVSPFPPLAPPSKTNLAAPPSVVQKLGRMKDAIIDAMEMPVMVMWHDESLSVQNKATSRLLHRAPARTPANPLQLLSDFKCYTEDFERQLQPDEYPITHLVRTQKPFSKWKIGVETPDSGRRHYSCSGEAIIDESTGKFIAGMIVLTDVTEYKDLIQAQHEQNDQQFEMICDTMPQLLWTTDPQGQHDWFSRRWYDYTGLSVEECLGEGWVEAFHPEDVKEAEKRWKHSLETGDEYSVEYRCRSREGSWKWMLGRALPLRDSKSKKVLKWFGTCTDIDAVVEARQDAKQMREQLLRVLQVAHVTIWAVNRKRDLTFLEGKLMWDEHEQSIHEGTVGYNIYEVFGKHLGKKDLPLYKEPIERILEGSSAEQTQEHHVDGNQRWYRTRFVPVIEPKRGRAQGDFIEGVVCISIDVTELKEREADLQSQSKENMRLLSAETAAKEASRLKSQFLANMCGSLNPPFCPVSFQWLWVDPLTLTRSHEIRTPIAGVIGMSELLLDTKLDQDQKECAENIQRSANGLLTVINDILDLSKVESGRLDIEEVQFSLSIVISDVCKMLSFAAERKNLIFESDIQIGTEKDLVVMGDPGRVRQILTNLLTNSIKFTSEGSVKLAVSARRETAEVVEVLFKVEDTGIGIEEEVRKRLFKPFSQADSSTARRFGGTGLGLTICKNLVDLMHGEIALESALDSGTTATFWIPFNKPQYTGTSSPMVDLGAIPERLRSEMSVSGCPSDHERGSATPPQSPQDGVGLMPLKSRRSGSLDKRKQVPNQDGSSPELDRKKTHVLVVEDNAINQQIALKTVKKFGFSVNAVWNGQQALDYLLNEPTPSRPRPDIILMDVQMPILDGYRATHYIRHHKPYAAIDNIRAVPIVAMTASAIQGDKEKCQKAGMDDYLAKPVRGPTLEKMLIKWAIEGQNPLRLEKTSSLSHADDSSNCTDLSGPNISVTEEPESLNGAGGTRRPAPTPRGADQAAANDLTNSSLRALSSEGDDGLQRAEAEEKATALRDDKLIAATEPNPSIADHASMTPTPQKTPPPPSNQPVRPGLARAALTEENINRLDRSQTQALPALKQEDSIGNSSSMRVLGSRSGSGSPAPSTVGDLKSPRKPQRPWGAGKSGLERNWSESTVTVSNERAKQKEPDGAVEEEVGGG